MGLTVCRKAPGGGGHNALWEVQACLCDGFRLHGKENAPPKVWISQMVLLRCPSRVECSGWEMEVGSRGFPLCLLISAFSVIPVEIPESVNLPHTCCLKHHEKELPRKLLVGYRKALNCYLPAIM